MAAVDEGEDEAKVRKYVEKHGLTYPVLLDPGQAVSPKLMGGGRPWNVIVDQQGIVRYSAAGFNAQMMKSVVEGLLNGRAKS